MRTETLKPVFLEGGNGLLFCLFGSKYDNEQPAVPDQGYSPNKASRKGRHHVALFLPPFGEELNLCRRFYSGVRQRLTQRDVQTVQPDLYGTGDSAGQLEDATWEIWQEDLRCIINHIAASNGAASQTVELSILAVRAGCLMIPDVIQFCDQAANPLKLKNLVMVQPDHQGEDVVNRLFRARTMAQRLVGDKSQSTQDLWKLVEYGETVHAGGHSLSAQLCQSLRDQRLQSLLASNAGIHRTWFNMPTRAAGNNEVESTTSSWTVEVHTHMPFWQSYDLEPDESLLDAVASAVVR